MRSKIKISGNEAFLMNLGGGKEGGGEVLDILHGLSLSCFIQMNTNNVQGLANFWHKMFNLILCIQSIQISR